MKSTIKKWNIVILAVMVIALVWPGTALAKGLFDDKVIFGDSFTLFADETLNGNLIVFAGTITLEAESTVNGDVVLMGGTVSANGLVNGSLIGIGGSVTLEESAQIHGDLVTIGATLNKNEAAQITGQVLKEFPERFQFSVPSEMNFSDDVFRRRVGLTDPLLSGAWFFFRIFIWAALAVLLVLFFSKETDRVSRAALAQPVITGGAGLLILMLFPIVVLVLGITIIGIPVALIAMVLLGVAWLIGWIALGLEVGRRIAKMFDQTWAPAVAAGAGTLVLYFVLGGFSLLVPCVGWLPKTMVGIWGLGAALTTYFGTREYPAENRTHDSQELKDIKPMDAPQIQEKEDSLPEDGLASEGDDR
ncbi:MAG: polymer-forming cytoskeletal protein [Anaerolineae bacterium]|nr:polymer-forming cytoskeletal protein [Anaerolineae bacterium]